MRSSWPADRFAGWVVPTLAIVAEGAFLAVVYVAVQAAIEGRGPLLGVLELSVATGLVAFAVHRRWIDPDDDPLPFLAVLGVLGLVGWGWDAEVRRLVIGGDLVAALGRHPGGWLTVVGGMRGVARGVELDDRALSTLVLLGVPALAAPWILGQLAAGEVRAVFVEEAFVASLSFVAAGFVAAGLARLQEIGRETGIDWRHDRSWLWTVLGVLVVVVAVGIPASILLGLPGDAVARGVLGPILGLLGYLIVAAATVTAVVAALLATALKSLGVTLPPPMTPEEIARLERVPTLTLEQVRGPLTFLVALWVVTAVVLVVLARVWLRRRARRAVGIGHEERSFRIPERTFRLARPRASGSSRPHPVRPSDAVTAYVAALDEIAAADASLARAEHETPRAHARRISAGPELVALQADYALARYGQRRLTDAEHGRALGRWRRIRAAMRRR